MSGLPDEPRSTPRASRMILGVLVVVVITAAAVALLQRVRTARSRGNPHDLVVELSYVSITTPPGGSRDGDLAPAGSLRLHYTIRNDGREPYRFAGINIAIAEHTGVPGAADRRLAPRVELPAEIAPMREAEIVVTKPYPRGWVERVPVTPFDPGEDDPLRPLPAPPPRAAAAIRAPRPAVTVVVAERLMHDRGMTTDQLLDHFDVVGDGLPREATAIGCAILRRQFPRLYGFVLTDDENRLRIELPTPPV